MQGEVRPFLGTIVSVRTSAAGCRSDAVVVAPTVYYKVSFDDSSAQELRRDQFKAVEGDEAEHAIALVSKFQRGQIVNVSFYMGYGLANQKFRGIVQRVNNDQQSGPTYDVLFEDGDMRTQIEEQWVTAN